ncbi:sensor domain-containing protein, partial [Saccharomonospora halophila]|uniref:sensor domain-containing protein n=1 Tax=Saccharomonospora halophila TaxID=129922 RepID=UPI0018DBFD33
MTPGHLDDRPPVRPRVAGAVAFTLLSLPAGLVSFVALVTLTAAGAPTVLVWVGVPVLAVALLVTRGGARLERA